MSALSVVGTGAELELEPHDSSVLVEHLHAGGLPEDGGGSPSPVPRGYICPDHGGIFTFDFPMLFTFELPQRFSITK